MSARESDQISICVCVCVCVCMCVCVCVCVCVYVCTCSTASSISSSTSPSICSSKKVAAYLNQDKRSCYAMLSDALPVLCDDFLVPREAVRCSIGAGRCVPGAMWCSLDAV
jgi:hypothetical protein